jgi:hypothetical protein
MVVPLFFRSPTSIRPAPGAPLLKEAAIIAPQQVNDEQIVQPSPSDQEIRYQVPGKEDIEQRSDQI